MTMRAFTIQVGVRWDSSANIYQLLKGKTSFHLHPPDLWHSLPAHLVSVCFLCTNKYNVDKVSGLNVGA